MHDRHISMRILLKSDSSSDLEMTNIYRVSRKRSKCMDLSHLVFSVSLRYFSQSKAITSECNHDYQILRATGCDLLKYHNIKWTSLNISVNVINNVVFVK